MFLYNSLSGKKEEFHSIDKDIVRMYSCGPTVYSYQHIGNLRAYIFVDSLKRALLFNGYKVNHIINITDVGHLTSDADAGDDKIELAAQKEQKSVEEITSYYFNIFESDLKKLNIILPQIWSKATNHISEQLELIRILEQKGFTYRTSDGIYFDRSKLDNFDPFRTSQGMIPGFRVEVGEKKSSNDFALWKFSKGNRLQEWDSPWGKGFPGWHIECSAMSMKYLGETFDIHTGGEDHIAVHHSNEIAQSESATGKKMANYWMHNGFLVNDKEEKYSKSKGNFTLLSELQYDPLVFRYLVLQTHYRKPLKFSKASMEAANNGFEKLQGIVRSIKTEIADVEFSYLEDAKKAVNDDLNYSEALAVMWKLLSSQLDNGKKYSTVIEMDKLFGFGLSELSLNINPLLSDLLQKRHLLRLQKRYNEADEVRNQILEMGYEVKDGKI